MYNYIGIIRKSTAVTHCINCHFFEEEKLNLVLSKTDRIEFYDLTKEGLNQNRYIDIYGKINLIVSIPSKDKKYKLKDNIFVLSEDLDFALLSYNKISNSIDSLITGSVREEIGRKQDNILYSLDNLKNFILISAFKNIFKLICVNNEMRVMEKYNDFTIKYQYEDILFLAPFSFNYYLNEINKNNNSEFHFKNLLVFSTIKVDTIDNRKNGNITDVNNNDLEQEINFETFQIKLEMNNYLYYPYQLKNELIYQYKNNQTNKKKDNKNNNEEYTIEDINMLQKICISNNPTVSLMITHPDGIVILFFSNYVIYYKYEPKKKKLISKEDKKVSYTDRKFINYTLINEKEWKYFVIDEYGNLFLLAFIEPFNDENNKFIFQFLGEINYSTCLTYLDNNYLFVGSYKSNSQLIKLESKDNSFIKVVENYESLAPISNLTLINNDIEDENNVEILTISGIEKNCCIKTIKKGTPAIFEDEIEIKNIKNVFKISLYENKNINTFIIVTINNSFIIDYDPISNIISLNTKINFHTNNNNAQDKNEEILFAKNIFPSIISIVTNSAILLYKVMEKEIKLIIRQIFENNNKVKPLLIKYNERLNSLFIYFNNKKFLCFKIDENGQIIYNKELLNDVNISSFGLCKYFIIYSQWDSTKLGIYSINTGKNNFMGEIDNSLDYVQISSIEIIKIEGIRFIIISLSNGKLLYFKLKEQFRNYNYHEFTEQDFIFKRKYNLSNENFTIRKIKINDTNNFNKKYLFLDTSTPSFIYFNQEIPVLLNLNLKHCKNILQLEENKYLFIYSNKIVFGSLSNVQSQNVHSKLYGNQLYNIDVISFGNNNLNVYKGEGIEMKEKPKNDANKKKTLNYILTIEEEKINDNIAKCYFVLSDEYLNEISRYCLEKENEICTCFSEIYNSNYIENKLIVLGTGISENPNEEPILGYIYLIEIDSNNNYSMKKIKEVETKGGIYKIRAYKNIIYASIGNTLLIYKLTKNYEIDKSNFNTYDFKLIRKCNDFTLINDIYIFEIDQNEKISKNNSKINSNLKKTEKIEVKDNKENFSDIDDFIDSKMNFSDEEEKTEENKSKIEENIHYLIISDLYRSIVLYSYDVNNDKFNEICRDYNLTWIYGISQYKNNLLYISDIDGNIVTLERNNHPKSDQEKFKFERKAYFNLGERINSLVMTNIKNNKLFLLSSENNKYDIINNNENYENNNEEELKVTYFGTLEGTVGIIISLNKELFDFLNALQNLMIKKIYNIGNFNYEKWRSFKDGFNSKESKGFIEGRIIEDFLNYDESYKYNLLNELNYPWNKSFNDVINIIETLAKCH